jgi:hypothetical protein
LRFEYFFGEVFEAAGGVRNGEFHRIDWTHGSFGGGGYLGIRRRGSQMKK